MKRVVTFCILLAALCCYTAFASTTPSQTPDAKASLGATRAAKPVQQKGVNTPFDLQVKKGQVDVSKVQQPSASADKSVEHANPLKAEYEAVLAQIAAAQEQGGDFSALKQQAGELYQQIYGSQAPARGLDQGGDVCASATVIGSLPYCDVGTTLGYTDDYNPGNCMFSQGAPDVVYVYTPATTVVVTISLCGSFYDTGLGVYDGCSPTANNIACNDDWCGLQSCVTATLQGGGTYYIIVDGFASAAGDYRLNITTDGTCGSGPCGPQAPANDLCANAASLSLPGSVTGSTVAATADPNAVDCGTSISAPGVWYRVIGDGTTLTATTCSNGTNYDSKLNVYTCGCDHLTCVTGNDDNCSGSNFLASTVSWCSTPGEAYLILVQGFAGSTGNFQLDVYGNEQLCDGGARCPCWDATLTAPGTMNGTTIGEDVDCPNIGCPDYRVQVTIPSAGQWNFSLCGSNYDTYLAIGTDCCLYDVCINDDNLCGTNYTLQSSCCVTIPAGVYYVTIFGFVCLTGDFVLTVEPCYVPPSGETCADAIVIGSLPYSATGTTIGHNDDIDPNCAYGTSAAPDVVYSFTPATDIDINVDLCGAYYDSKVFVVDAASGEVLCCNDDACDNPNWPNDEGFQSYIGCCHLLAGHRYCIVVDGYCSACVGDYTLIVTQGECGGGCVVVCPQGSTPEGEDCEEPDTFNGGCNSVPPAFSPIHCGETVCGTAYAANGTRDTDWYELVLTQPTTVNWCAYAEFAPQVAIVGPGPNGCSDLVLYANTFEGTAPCQVACASVQCLPAGTYWLFVAATTFDAVPCSDYIAHVECTPCGGCNPTPVVQMSSTPVPQYQCADLCPGAITTLVICGESMNPNQMPIVSVTSGCSPQNTRCDRECDPAQFEYNPAGWVLDGNCWYNHIIGASAGCVCVCLEGFLGVEFNHDFTAIASDGAVALSWSTASESNNARFDILRDGETVAQVPAANITTGHAYAWTDRQVQNGTSYSYTLVAVDVNGNREELATTNALPSFGTAVISEYALHQNYPNPFNPETNITFDLVEAGHVSLAVYNLMGQQVAAVVNGQLASGRHTISFNATNLPSGVYVYKLNVNGFVAEKKMLLMK